MGEPGALAPLITYFTDQNGDLRRLAAESLVVFGDARGLEPSIAFLKTQDAEVRRSAVEALGKSGDAQVAQDVGHHYRIAVQML